MSERGSNGARRLKPWLFLFGLAGLGMGVWVFGRRRRGRTRDPLPDRPDGD